MLKNFSAAGDFGRGDPIFVSIDSAAGSTRLGETTAAKHSLCAAQTDDRS